MEALNKREFALKNGFAIRLSYTILIQDSRE